VLVGVVSDTHGCLHPGVFTALSGVERILHAGDVGAEDVLAELAAIAPVSCVRGNVDEPSIGPEERLIEIEGTRILLVHQAPAADALPGDWSRRIAREGIGVVVYGHTHRPLIAEGAGALFVNPGGCGRPRFGLPLAVARLWTGVTPRAEIVRLT